MGIRPTGLPRLSKTKRKPVIEPLEPRELCAVTSFKATAAPQVLVPQNNRWVPVLVQGTFTTNEKEEVSANYQVVDGYHEYQKQGLIRFQRTDTEGRSFKFAFVLHLRASVSSSAASARQYYLVLAAKDNDGANGKVVPVIVPPISASKPHPVPPRAQAFAHRTR